MQKLTIILIMFMCSILFAETMIINFIDGSTIEFDTTEIFEITFDNVTVEEMVNLMSQIPIRYINNYPNPFNPNTTISFEISESGQTLIEVFNMKGQSIITLLDQHMENGKHTVEWSGIDRNNKQVSSGIYFYKISVNGNQKVNKMIMLK